MRAVRDDYEVIASIRIIDMTMAKRTTPTSARCASCPPEARVRGDRTVSLCGTCPHLAALTVGVTPLARAPRRAGAHPSPALGPPGAGLGSGAVWPTVAPPELRGRDD